MTGVLSPLAGADGTFNVTRTNCSMMRTPPVRKMRSRLLMKGKLPPPPPPAGGELTMHVDAHVKETSQGDDDLIDIQGGMLGNSTEMYVG